MVNGYKWELYNLKEDFSEYNDLAAKMPDKLREMQELFLVEAAKYNVFPLDNSIFDALHRRRGRAPPPGGTSSPTPGEMSGMPDSDAPSILNQSYTITAEVEVPQGGGGEGMAVGDHGRPLRRLRPLPAQGQAGVHLQLAGPGALPLGRQGGARAGQAHARVRLQYDGPGFGKGGTGVLKVDGKEVAKQKIPHTIPFL